MPKVQTVVETFFGKKPSIGVNPNEVVAIGAAIRGYSFLKYLFYL
jgi:molecular chaperone DnaK